MTDLSAGGAWVCANCHAEGVNAEWPRLADKENVYLVQECKGCGAGFKFECEGKVYREEQGDYREAGQALQG
jgi:RNase P subunit RPR2